MNIPITRYGYFLETAYGFRNPKVTQKNHEDNHIWSIRMTEYHNGEPGFGCLDAIIGKTLMESIWYNSWLEATTSGMQSQLSQAPLLR